MNELNDAQRVNNMKVTILGFESKHKPCSKIVVNMKFYTQTSAGTIGKLSLQKSFGNLYKDMPSLFLIRQFDLEKKEQTVMSFDYQIDCIRERDISDFFKFMYQGFIQVDLIDQSSQFKIGSASCNILTALR